MNWTLDTPVCVTPTGRAASRGTAPNRRKPARAVVIPTQAGRNAVRPLQQARDAILAATVAETTCADSNL